MSNETKEDSRSSGRRSRAKVQQELKSTGFRGEKASSNTQEGAAYAASQLQSLRAVNFDCSSQHNGPLSDSELAEMAKKSAQHQKKWNRRLKIFFCCLGYKKNKDSIADVASIFAEFYSDLNVPSSDIAAGFVLLSKYQAAQRQWILRHSEQLGLGIDQYLSGIPIKEETKFLDISIAEDSHLINDLVYYMNYSLAIFGWPLQVIDDPCMLCCIYPYLRLSSCCTGVKRKSPSNKKAGASDKKVEKAENKKEKEKLKKENAKAKKESNWNKGEQEQIDHSAEQVHGVTGLPHDEHNHTNNNKCNGNKHQEQPYQMAEDSVQMRERGSSRKQDVTGQLNEDCNIPIILEDNCCSCNVASAERRLAKHNYEIIYVSYKSKINVVPFLVAADHSKQTIVVAIRGSMNLSDMVTDLNGTVDKVPVENCPDDWLCHRGITNASLYVKKTLLEKRILERAFNCRPELGSQDYNLVICGHSLGAGAAAILGVLMRAQFPNLKAFLYSPPGGILSLPVVEYTKQFAVGIILGNDTVARLGVAQLERLRYYTLLSVKSSQKSSGKIVARALCPSICCGSNQVDYDPDQSLDLLYGTGGRSFDYNNRKIPFQVQPQVLYVPGRLIHIVKNHNFRSKTHRLWHGPIYQAVWTDNTTYDRVLISEGMFLDHLPNKLMHAMKMLFSRTLPDRRDSRLSTSLVMGTPISAPDPTTVGMPLANQESKLELIETIDKIGDPSEGQQDSRDDENDRLAREKNVIDDDDENNNISNNNNNADGNSADLNNNNNSTKIYPNLNRSNNSSSTNIKKDSSNGSTPSVSQEP